MPDTSSTGGAHDRSERAAFTRCWRENVDRLHAYAVRHVGPDDAPEIVAEAFLQAWRRWPGVPQPALPWLIGTARRIVANQRRGRRRRDALADRVALLDGAAAHAEGADVLATDRQAAITALASLSAGEREALLLVVWDGLAPDQAAAALGVRPGTFRVRLHRARARLADATSRPTPDSEEIPCTSS